MNTNAQPTDPLLRLPSSLSLETGRDYRGLYLQGPEIHLNENETETPIWTAFVGDGEGDEVEAPHWFTSYTSALYWATLLAANLGLELHNDAEPA